MTRHLRDSGIDLNIANSFVIVLLSYPVPSSSARQRSLRTVYRRSR